VKTIADIFDEKLVNNIAKSHAELKKQISALVLPLKEFIENRTWANTKLKIFENVTKYEEWYGGMCYKTLYIGCEYEELKNGSGVMAISEAETFLAKELSGKSDISIVLVVPNPETFG